MKTADKAAIPAAEHYMTTLFHMIDHERVPDFDINATDEYVEELASRMASTPDDDDNHTPAGAALAWIN